MRRTKATQATTPPEIQKPDEQAARHWAAKIAVACGWPQEVRRFQVPGQLPETS